MDGNAPSRPRAQFLRDLNMFLGAMFVCGSFGIALLLVPTGLMLRMVLPRQQAEALALPFGYVVLAFALAWWWRKWGFSPAVPKAGSERRLHIGHFLLATGNVFLLGAFAAAWILPKLNLPQLPGVALPAFGLLSLAPLLAIAGFFMVWRTPAAEFEFAPTQPMPSRPARQSSKAEARKRAGSNVMIVLGVAASSLVLFVAGVFGVLAFHDHVALYLVISGTIAVLWLTATLWARLRGALRAASYLAWGPVMLILLLQVVQIVASIFLLRHH